MAQLEHYISVGSRRLRCGYTTGTCGAGASVACAHFLLTGQWPATIVVDTPANISVEMEPLVTQYGDNWASCAMRKDAGDDPDVTHGILIYSRVETIAISNIQIDGGEGVGRVTQKGLNQPVGAAAINSVPRSMIADAITKIAQSHGYTGGFAVQISVPNGAQIAKKTFNPRLGIEGGISILGTSGIVRPMSEDALIDTIKVELNMLHARESLDIVLTFGNYGEDFCRDVLGLPLHSWAMCSNYLGQALDYCALLGFRSVLLVGHLGKIIKVSTGGMNTHSKVSDGRREAITAHAALCGVTGDILRQLYDSVTTEGCVDILTEIQCCNPVMESIARALQDVLRHRGGTMQVESLFFTKPHGKLGQTSGAEDLLQRHRRTAPCIL